MTPSPPPDASEISTFKKFFSEWEQKFSFFSKQGKVFRWAVFLGVFSVFVFGLFTFLGSVVEPRLGVSLMAEATDSGEAAAPILEKIPFTEQAEKQSENPAFLPLPQKEEIPPAPLAEIEEIKRQNQDLANRFLKFMVQQEKQQRLWAAYILLRQDVRQEAPFEVSLAHFETFLPQDSPLKEVFDQLQPFAKQGIWSFGKILNQFSKRYFLTEPEKTGLWENVAGFFKKLWVMHRADEPQSLLEQQLFEAEKQLHQGHLEKALSLLQSLPLSKDSTAQEWFHQAQRFVKIEKAFQDFEQHLFDSRLWDAR